MGIEVGMRTSWQRVVEEGTHERVLIDLARSLGAWAGRSKVLSTPQLHVEGVPE